MNIEETAERIRLMLNIDKPILIAIDGFGGSGKSTIARKLQKLLIDCYVVSIDDFIIKERLIEVSADEVLFDRMRLKRQVLLPVHSGNQAAYQKLEWSKGVLSEPLNIPKVGYVIVEGISSLHPDIAEYFDYKIWVDVPAQIAKERGEDRDRGNENEKHWGLWSANDVAYQQKYHPEQVADLIVRNY